MQSQIELDSVITEAQDGLRFDLALARLFPSFSRTQMKHWILEGVVTLDDELCTLPKHIVCTDQTVSIKTTLDNHNDWVATDMPLNIVHEDDDIIVINKPANLVVHPAAGHRDDTLANALLHHCPHLQKLPRCGLIHRIDKDTTGLLVIAKTLEAHILLVSALHDRKIKREYMALVHGEVVAGTTIDAPLGRHKTQRKKMAINENGKSAVTHTRVKQKFPKHTLLTVSLETGRTHQIRVHLEHIKLPIVGDPLYNNRYNDIYDQQLKRQALHAFRLTLQHPTTHETCHFEAPLPDDLQAVLTQLEQSTCA